MPHQLGTRQSSASTAFSIPDSSPVFSYSSKDGSSWTAGYAKQSDGYDRTMHFTSNSESSISFNITSSSLILLMPSYAGCQATLSINSSTPVPACTTASANGDSPFALNNLPTGLHRVQWDSGTVPSGSQVVFWGIDGERPEEIRGMSNVTIDDTYSGTGIVSMTYVGDWRNLNEKSSSTLSEMKDLVHDFNRTLAITQRKDASVKFSGRGSAVYLYGTVGPDYGHSSLSLNGHVVATNMSLTSPWDMPYQLLWFGTGLNASQKMDIIMTNLEDKKMSVDFMILTTDGQVISTLPTSPGATTFVSALAGKMVLFLLVPLIVVLLVGVALFYFCTKRRERMRRCSGDSSMPLGSDTGGNGHEKRRSSWFTRSAPSVHEVFVSYDEARSQRMSDRWQSPSTIEGSTTSGSARTFRSAMATLPEGRTTMYDSFNDVSTAGTWSGPANDLLDSEYSRSSRNSTPLDRRQTGLPPYTPGDTATYQSSDGESNPIPALPPSAFNEKLHLQNLPGPSYTRHSRPPSTIAPDDVLSVYGQPPSERRNSSETMYSRYTSTTHPPLPSFLPPFRPSVTVNTLDLRHASSPSSAVSSYPTTSALHSLPADSVKPFQEGPLSPPSAISLRSTEWPIVRDSQAIPGHLVRSRSSALSGNSTGESSARPDSEVIPFESFLGSLDMGQSIRLRDLRMSGSHQGDR